VTTSLYQIDFTDTATGTPRRLLNYGDSLDSALTFTASQQATVTLSLGAVWGGATPAGGLRSSLTWQRQLEHASQAEADAYVLSHPLSLPFLTAGKIRVSVHGEASWDLVDAIVLDVSSSRDNRGDCATLTRYQLDCGQTLAVTAPDPDSLPPVLMPTLAVRITDDGFQKWFEVGFIGDELLTGCAATGWSGPGGEVIIELERSDDLAVWSTGHFIDCAGSPAHNTDGTWSYWSRSIYPNDSQMKTGKLVAKATGSEDVRNQPFTSLVINNEVQDLHHYPYQMPEDALQLQLDLQDRWPGATVEASSWDVWRIEVPGVEFSFYNSTSKVFWPVWSTYDLFGNLITVTGKSFTGEYLNSSGVRTALPHQFARLLARQA